MENKVASDKANLVISDIGLLVIFYSLEDHSGQSPSFVSIPISRVDIISP